MTNFDSATEIICSTCGTVWQRSDATVRRYFKSASIPLNGSPALIVAAAEDMTFCPACNVGVLERASIALESGQFALDARTDPDGLDGERAGSGGADVVYDSHNQTRK